MYFKDLPQRVKAILYFQLRPLFSGATSGIIRFRKDGNDDIDYCLVGNICQGNPRYFFISLKPYSYYEGKYFLYIFM